MRKQVVVAAAALILAGTSLALAQDFRGPRAQDWRDGFERRQLSADDIEAFAEARIAGMKAGLRLSPEQEKNWPAFEQAYRGLAKQRAEMVTTRRNGPQPGNVVERMQRRADFMTRRAAGLKQLADAAAPLYQSLDDAQKRRFTMLARMLRPRPMMGTRERGHGHMWQRGFGPGRFNERGEFRRRFGEDRDFDGGPSRTGRIEGDPTADDLDAIDLADHYLSDDGQSR